jgi:hypothetical protein
MFGKDFPENRTLYEKVWKYMVVRDRAQMAIYYGACALHAGCLSVQTHTRNM